MNDSSSILENARILIIGAGVNGSVCAVELFKAGIDVRVLARGKRFEELRDEGIVIEDPFKHTRRLTRVPVIDRLDADDVYDFMLVVVRKNQAAGLLPVLAENRSANIVFMGNNLTGPQEFVEVLGKERVMMGGVFAAGKRDGSLIRAMIIKSVAVPFGEIDGKITPRLERLAAIFRHAGFKVGLSTHIVDSQLAHGVGVALIASLAMKHGGDIKALARAKDDLKLFVHARREGHRLLRALGHLVPRSESFMGNVPGFLQIAGLQALLNSKMGEVGLAWHLYQAPDEIQQLIREMQELLDQSNLPVPAIRKVLGAT
jgi:2-dehydropantoate 2-reductase